MDRVAIQPYDPEDPRFVTRSQPSPPTPATTETTPADTAPETSRPSSPLVIAVLSICGTVVSLQQTLVVPLLPEFPRLLGTTLENASWLVTITLLVGAVATPIVARLADMFGKRRMMLLCLGAVVVGSLIAALGPSSLSVVVLGRGLQGMGAALIPVGISIMRDELPPERVGSAVALMSATLGIGGAAGMPLSGIITERFSWHALFWVSAAFAAVMLAAVVLVIPESKVRTGGRFDYLGAVLLSVALLTLLLGISKGGTWGWTDERTIVCFVLAIVFFAIWLPVELRTGRPLVDLRTSVRRPVLLTNVASLLLGFAMFANMLSTTQQMQMPTSTGYGFGLSVTAAGLSMLPGGLSMVAFAPVSAAMTRRYGARVTLITGALIMAVGYVMRVFLTHTVAQVLIGSTVISIGTAVGYAAMPTLIMRSVPITETASANGLNTLLRAIGTATSSAAVAAMLSATTMTVGGVQMPSLAAFQHGFWLAALAALAGAGAALALPTAPTRPPEPAEVVGRTGQGSETIVEGRVLRADGSAIAKAVVSGLRPSGAQVDWGRTDDDGRYRLALSGQDALVLVATADGFAPCAERVEVAGDTLPPITLGERLTLSGTVRDGDAPAAGATVTLVRHLGEHQAHTTTDDGGRYTLDLPPGGRYVLTVLPAGGGHVTARSIAVRQEPMELDLDLADGAGG